jgi:hypothetical protein
MKLLKEFEEKKTITQIQDKVNLALLLQKWITAKTIFYISPLD